jgi:hypothetical protein
MKAFSIRRPDVTTYVQWDGTNQAEFEEITSATWGWISMTGTPTYVQNGTDLEVWTSGQLLTVIPLNYWFAGFTMLPTLDNLPDEESLVSNPSVEYTTQPRGRSNNRK